MPGESVSITTSFAVATFPPNAVATPVPDDGLLKVHVSELTPTAQEIADMPGRASAGGIEVLAVAEIVASATRVAFDTPVFILLVGRPTAARSTSMRSAGWSLSVTRTLRQR